MRIALLDDYQNVAREMADWAGLGADCEVVSFQDHLRDNHAIARRLHDFEVVMPLRERTPFPRALLEKLPRLRLLVTTGMRNASIDLAAARERGVVVCGTPGASGTTGELTWGLIHALFRQIPREDRLVREGKWQTTVGLGLAGKTLGILGLGTIGSQVAKARPAPAPPRAPGRPPHPSRGARARARPDGRARARHDEAHRLPREHLARSDCRRGRARRGAEERHDRGRGNRRLRQRADRAGPSAALRAEHRAHAAPRLRDARRLQRLLPRRGRGHRRLAARRARARAMTYCLAAARRQGG